MTKITRKNINFDIQSKLENGYYRRRLCEDFKELTKSEEMQISSNTIDFIFYVNRNKELFHNIFRKKYGNLSFDDALVDYYFQNVIKPTQIEEWLQSISVSAEAVAFIKYLYQTYKPIYFFIC